MKAHILIIDDEAPIRDLLAQFLTTRGYRATPIGRAADAIAAVKAEIPNLIICDLQLEDADGLDLIGQLKALAPQTPIVLLTGVYFDPEVTRGLVGANVADYIQKTTPLEGILAAIRRLVP